MLTELTELSHKMKGRNEGYTKWNKGKYTWNQQLCKVNWDSNQWFGTIGRNKHSIGTEWRNKNLKKNEGDLKRTESGECASEKNQVE